MTVWCDRQIRWSGIEIRTANDNSPLGDMAGRRSD